MITCISPNEMDSLRRIKYQRRRKCHVAEIRLSLDY